MVFLVPERNAGCPQIIMRQGKGASRGERSSKHSIKCPPQTTEHHFGSDDDCSAATVPRHGGWLIGSEKRGVDFHRRKTSMWFVSWKKICYPCIYPPINRVRYRSGGAMLISYFDDRCLAYWCFFTRT